MARTPESERNEYKRAWKPKPADPNPSRRGKNGLKKVSLLKLRVIAEAMLKGMSLRDIAEKTGLSYSVVYKQYHNNIKPEWEKVFKADAVETMAKVRYLYKRAWLLFEESRLPITKDQIERQFNEAGLDGKLAKRVRTITKRTGESCWFDVMRWCLEFEAKIGGMFAPDRLAVELQGGLRVAGLTGPDGAESVDEAMMRKVWEGVEKRRAMITKAERN